MNAKVGYIKVKDNMDSGLEALKTLGLYLGANTNK